MEDERRIGRAREFLRSLNVLLKAVRLYSLEHSRASVQLDAAWKLLAMALSEQGSSGLLLAVSGTQLLVDGLPLESTAAERSFAELLSAAGIASVHFSARVTQEDFRRFVRAFSARGGKPTGLAEQLKAEFGESSDAPVRINRVRFVAEDAEQGEARTASAAVTLVAQTLQPEAEKLKEWLKEPQKLLQLLLVSEVAKAESGGPAVASASPAAAPLAQEEEVTAVVRLLGQLGQASAQTGAAMDPGQIRRQFTGMSAAAQVSMREALASLAAARLPADLPPSQVLVQLAEQLAIRHALERFQRGEVRVDTVREMMERMGREIDSLRKMLGTYEEKMGRAGVTVESHSEILDREFWMRVPESGKRSVLLSPEAWCIPPRNISLYLEQLVGCGDSQTANAILRNYAACVRSSEAQARRKAAVGLGELAKFYAAATDEVADFVVRQMGWQLSRESAPEVQTQLSETFSRLSQEVTARRRYPVIEQIYKQLENVADSQPAVAEKLRSRIGLESRVREFIEEALRAERIPAGLVALLRGMPRLAAEELAGRFRQCNRRRECERLVEMLKEIGPEGLSHLHEALQHGPDSAAVSTVGLLSRLEPAALELAVPPRLQKWGRTYHQLLLGQLALAGARERASLLLKWLPQLDPLLLSGVIDELGMSGDQAAVPYLIQLAGGEVPQLAAPYLRLKAIEALGRLRNPQAVPILRRLVEAKRGWSWQHPRELRLVAAQALAKIDPPWAMSDLAATGLTAEELALSPPLDPEPSTGWSRARRYPRLMLALPLPGVATADRGESKLTIKALNLGGGLAACDPPLPSGSPANLQLRSGFRSITAQVLVREARGGHMAFEIVAMDFEERGKLRKLLASLRTVAL